MAQGIKGTIGGMKEPVNIDAAERYRTYNARKIVESEIKRHEAGKCYSAGCDRPLKTTWCCGYHAAMNAESSRRYRQGLTRKNTPKGEPNPEKAKEAYTKRLQRKLLRQARSLKTL